MHRKYRVALVGNPNAGKSSLFNALTGVRQSVANWPGVTVEKKVGHFMAGGEDFEVIDLPGIYSITAVSIDEILARDCVLSQDIDLVVNVVDASHLERNLYLTVQLLEMRVPVLVVLNKMDVVNNDNIKIDVERLSNLLSSPVVAGSAHQKNGLKSVKSAVLKNCRSSEESLFRVPYPKIIAQTIDQLLPHIQNMKQALPYDSAWVALKVLEDDPVLRPNEHQSLRSIIKKRAVENEPHQQLDWDMLIADARYGVVHSISQTVLDHTQRLKRSLTAVIDKFVLNRVLGLPIFLGMMYLTFWITINLGGCFIDFFDGVSGAIFVDAWAWALNQMSTPSWLVALLAGGLGKGIQTVATFVPPIFFMFLMLTILEDSGYMARAGFVMDKFMRRIGLPGKAIVPLLVGFGCNVPAIMAARTLNEEEDRITTVMMAPFMSCGARMPVYALFAAAFFPQHGDLVVFSLYGFGIVLAILTGLILKRYILVKKSSNLIMELPPYQLPHPRNIFLNTWQKLYGFIVNAGKVIVLVVMLLSFLNSFDMQGGFQQVERQDSILSIVGKKITPIFAPMGMTEDNWPAAVGILTGIFAKEAVIGTLDALYPAQETLIESWSGVGPAIYDAWQTIPANFADLRMPFSFMALIGADLSDAQASLEVQDETYMAMQSRFNGPIAAYAYLLMILLYMPCVAAVGAVYRELNRQWAIVSVVYLTALAWVSATLFYQVMTIMNNPFSSLAWITGLSGLMGLCWWFLVKQRRAVLIKRERQYAI